MSNFTPAWEAFGLCIRVSPWEVVFPLLQMFTVRKYGRQLHCFPHVLCFLFASPHSFTFFIFDLLTQIELCWGKATQSCCCVDWEVRPKKQWKGSEGLMRILADERRSLELWGLCHQQACSLLQLWHHRSIPFHRAGTTETPITLLISCSPSLTHSCLALRSIWPTSIHRNVLFNF